MAASRPRPMPPPQMQGLQYGGLRKFAPLPSIGASPAAGSAAAPAKASVKFAPTPAPAPAADHPSGDEDEDDGDADHAAEDHGAGDEAARADEEEADAADAILMVDVPSAPRDDAPLPLALLAYLDPSFVGQWRERTRDAQDTLAAWWAQGKHALEFAHFWLAEMLDSKRQELFQMEAALLVDELRMALHAAADEADLAFPADAPARLFAAMLHEYPDQFAGDGTEFLDLTHVIAACAAQGQGLSYGEPRELSHESALGCTRRANFRHA